MDEETKAKVRPKRARHPEAAYSPKMMQYIIHHYRKIIISYLFELRVFMYGHLFKFSHNEICKFEKKCNLLIDYKCSFTSGETLT
uniref:Uncharacterized protein n=1 Tax=Ascaris lumbricoides TaxID=6252 RepID=A0A0M3ITC4_ASCLU